MNKYTIELYSTFQEASRNSVAQIIPILQELLDIKSGFDIGCGVDTWLSVYRYLGIVNVLDVDGDYVKRQPFAIARLV